MLEFTSTALPAWVPYRQTNITKSTIYMSSVSTAVSQQKLIASSYSASSSTWYRARTNEYRWHGFTAGQMPCHQTNSVTALNKRTS